MSALSCSLFLAVISITAVLFSEGTDRRTPLDLPVSPASQDDEEEEDAPESILFFGVEFEGEAFAWCLPTFWLKPT